MSTYRKVHLCCTGCEPLWLVPCHVCLVRRGIAAVKMHVAARVQRLLGCLDRCNRVECGANWNDHGQAIWRLEKSLLSPEILCTDAYSQCSQQRQFYESELAFIHAVNIILIRSQQ